MPKTIADDVYERRSFSKAIREEKEGNCEILTIAFETRKEEGIEKLKREERLKDGCSL